MDIKTLNLDTITLRDVFSRGDSLYVIKENQDGTYEMNRLMSDDKLSRDIFGYGDCAVISIASGSKDQIASQIAIRNDYKASISKRRGRLTYKYDGEFPKGRIEFRPAISGIRISFYDKKDAEEYFDYFREQFYTQDIPAISISSIYKDLSVVNYNEEECNRWGYPVLDGGPCKYLASEGITKTRGPEGMYGFTLKRPFIINGMAETKWYLDKYKRTNKTIPREVNN